MPFTPEEHKQMRESRRAAGLCIMCGKNPAKEDRARCEGCLSKSSKSSLQYQRKEPAFTEQEAITEAKWMVQATLNGVDVSDTLNISEETRTSLERFCVENPDDAYIVKRSLEFRDKINEHYKRLLAEGIANVKDEEPEEAEVAESVIAEAARWSAPTEEEHSSEEGEAQAADYGF